MDHVLRAGIALLAVSASACVSSSELESIDARLADLQVQVLQVQKQSPTKAELQALETTLRERIETLVESQANVQADLDGLTRQVERLRSKLDETHFELAALGQQLEATHEQLEEVRSVAEQANRPATPAPVRLPTDTSDPRELYDLGYSDYVAGNYDLAILAFRRYLENHPATDLADNATYWLGECYYRRGQFQRAIQQFDAVLESFQRSDRAISARLKKAYAHLELGQRDEGVAHLRQVVCEHRQTDEALLAGKRLQELGFDENCQVGL